MQIAAQTPNVVSLSLPEERFDPQATRKVVSLKQRARKGKGNKQSISALSRYLMPVLRNLTRKGGKLVLAKANTYALRSASE